MPIDTLMGLKVRSVLALLLLGIADPCHALPITDTSTLVARVIIVSDSSDRSRLLPLYIVLCIVSVFSTLVLIGLRNKRRRAYEEAQAQAQARALQSAAAQPGMSSEVIPMAKFDYEQPPPAYIKTQSVSEGSVGFGSAETGAGRGPTTQFPVTDVGKSRGGL